MSSLIPYDPQRLLSYKPETATEWATRHRTIRYGDYDAPRWGESGAMTPVNVEEFHKIMTGFHEKMREHVAKAKERIDRHFADTLVLADYAALEAAALRSMLHSGHAVTIYDPGKPARVLSPEEVDDLVSVSPYGVVLDLSRYPNGGTISGRRWSILDRPSLELQERHKTTKQNGRSSAYLKHDPTKNGRTKR